MAAEIVSSAVAQEAVNQVLSRFMESHQHKSDAKEHMERMEMAHIKLEAALETSNRWHVTSVPLLHWRSKLKRAAQECDETLRRCRQRLQEEEETQNSVRGSSFPVRIAYTARSFISSIFSPRDDDELSGTAAVRRFERFVDGASEFLRYVELGGTPRRYMFFDPLIRHLLAGKGTKYCFVRGGQHLSFILQPYSPPNHGMEGSLIFLLEDANAPENNFLLALILRLSESTDIVGVAVRCLKLFIPHLSSTAETVKTKLTQVPTQDLSWVSDAYSSFGSDEHQNNIQNISSKWFRPNPFCCQQQDHHHSQSSSSVSLPSDIYLEPVNLVYLTGQVALSVGNDSQRVVIDGKSHTSLMRDLPNLKLGVHIWPHASSEDFPSGVGGSTSETINGKATQRAMYANISIEQLGEIMVPKAVDRLSNYVAATSYQTLWNSRHGRAYLHVEKNSWRATTRKDRDVKHPRKRRGKKVRGWTSSNNEFMSSWIAHAPAQLESSVVDYWIQKEKRWTLPLLLKTNACVHDCPIMSLLRFQDNRSLARKLKLSSAFDA